MAGCRALLFGHSNAAAELLQCLQAVGPARVPPAVLDILAALRAGNFARHGQHPQPTTEQRDRKPEEKCVVRLR